MDALFGEERANSLRTRLVGLKSIEREETIMKELYNAIIEIGGNYIHPFRFKDETGNRTSHQLIFVSKHIRGYQFMKDITAKYSSSMDQGVPDYKYAPQKVHQLDMFKPSPLDDLKKMLLEEYAGHEMQVKEVFDQHNVGRRFRENHYKQVLRELEDEGKVRIDPPATERRKGTLKDDAVVTFPERNV